MVTIFKRARLHTNDAQIALLSFALLIIIGTLLLMLPVSTRGEPLCFIDALFTATSATCVTGLTVLDTGTKFTAFGQGVILALIQLGGLGIMTFSTFILFVLGGKAPLQLQDAVSSSFLELRRYSLKDMIKRAFVFTLAFELAGAVLLFSRWAGVYPFRSAAWFSVFHSISAFCNAGFSLFPDSLIKYADDPLINFTIMPLIIFGGIGFFVIADLWDIFKKKHEQSAKHTISFHTKLVISVSALLIFGGAALFYAIEYSHNLADLSVGKGIMRSLFQSVTSRTAGFNTLDIKHLSNATLFLIIFLMFAGGAPGSMAGGIKVTAVGIILVIASSRLRGMRAPGIFGRSLDREDIERVVVLILLSSVLITVMTMMLLITELGGIPHTESRGIFLEILFECMSAFGTVGLSTGVTPNLSTSGRLLITFLMYAGRLGPLTLVYAMERRKAKVAYRYPVERIMIG